jgi:hypothetical protein
VNVLDPMAAITNTKTAPGGFRASRGETTMIVELVHTAVVNGKPLRFFRSPIGNTDPDWYLWEECCETPKPELPDFPWLALGDLMTCLAMPLDKQERLLRQYEPPARIVTIKDLSVREGQPTDHELPCTQTVVTTDGIVVIAPEILAQSIFPSGLQCPSSLEWRKSYEIAERAALNIVTAGLSVHELQEWLMGADERRHLNRMAMGTARRGNNETTWHGLTLIGPEPATLAA